MLKEGEKFRVFNLNSSKTVSEFNYPSHFPPFIKSCKGLKTSSFNHPIIMLHSSLPALGQMWNAVSYEQRDHSLNVSGGQKDVVASNLQNCEDLPRVEVDIVQLSNEHSCHALENSCSIHVYSGPNGKDKPADPLVDFVVLLNTLDHGRECG